MARRYFDEGLFEFLAELAENNDREWFKAHQSDYERHVREPALDLITDFAAPLSTISGEFVADSRTVGGSLFRIQRDTRFAKDKTPYKSNTGMQFRHRMGKDVHAPGFYVHIQPRECYMGVGIWRPETRVAYRIRDAIAADPAGWNSAASGRRFRSHFRLEGETLSRPPKGYPADHPLIQDLKRKDFIAGCRLEDSLITGDSLLEELARRCRSAAPFMQFLCSAVGVPF